MGKRKSLQLGEAGDLFYNMHSFLYTTCTSICVCFSSFPSLSLSRFLVRRLQACLQLRLARGASRSGVMNGLFCLSNRIRLFTVISNLHKTKGNYLKQSPPTRCTTKRFSRHSLATSSQTKPSKRLSCQVGQSKTPTNQSQLQPQVIKDKKLPKKHALSH